MQPWPTYFKVPRRCQVFGVHAEDIGRQMNYLTDESISCGTGANAVISMPHHFLAPQPHPYMPTIILTQTVSQPRP